MQISTLSTRPHIDQCGAPSKALVIVTADGDDITITLGVEEARALAAALKPNGKDITLAGIQKA